LKLSLSKNKIIACYVGSLHENRGIEEILEIAREFTFIDFVIIGGPKLRLEYYKDLISRKYRSLKNVILLGHLSNSLIPKYLKGSDILLAPYSKKIKTVDHMSPIKLIEYMASKTPIITSDLPRIRELLDESTSTFFMPDDIESLRKNLVYE
jgi:glycosyltransferase involved in cell wall biosynthesis